MTTSRYSPTEFRRVVQPVPESDNPYERDTYVVSRTQIIGTQFFVYEAWEIANGRTMEFSTTRYEESAEVGGSWLGRIGTHNYVANPEPRQAQYELAYLIIREAYPEIVSWETDDSVNVRHSMGAIDVHHGVQHSTRT